LININKLRVLYQAVVKFQRLQSQTFNFAKVNGLFEYLATADFEGGDKKLLYQLSLKIEPKK